jgi:hypothetical protein
MIIGQAEAAAREPEDRSHAHFSGQLTPSQGCRYVLLLMQTVLLWQMASLARLNPSLVRPLIGAVCVASLIGTAVIWAFIFAVPALMSLACTVCVGLAFVSASRTTRAEEVRPTT